MTYITEVKNTINPKKNEVKNGDTQHEENTEIKDRKTKWDEKKATIQSEEVYHSSQIQVYVKLLSLPYYCLCSQY